MFSIILFFPGHLYPQAIPGDPEFSHIEKDGEVKYEVTACSDSKHSNVKWRLNLV